VPVTAPEMKTTSGAKPSSVQTGVPVSRLPAGQTRVGCTDIVRKGNARQMAVNKKPLVFCHRIRLMVHRFF